MKPTFMQQLLHHLLVMMMMTLQMTNGVLKYPKSGIGNFFTNMAVHDESVYLAENGKLSRLHVTDLSLNMSIGTCADTSVDCENVNKILLVNDSRIITCGTGNGGRCERRSSELLEVLATSRVDQRSDVVVVSSDLNRPAVGLLLEGTGSNMVFGVTQGPPLMMFYVGRFKDPPYGYKYFISMRSLNFERLSYRPLHLFENQQYIVYFRHVFSYNGFVYFLTNQKITIGNYRYVTKLLSVCPNERTQGALESYVDIMLSCTHNGSEFGLLQDADFIQVGGSGKVVGIFSQGNNPESPSADRAVCVFSMDDIIKTISAAREDYIVSPGNAWAKTSHYIWKSESLDHWFIQKDYYIEEDFSCGEIPRPTVGNKVLSSNASYHSDGRDSTLTKIKADTKYGSILDVFLGASSGDVLMLSWQGGDTLHNYDTQPSEGSGAVRAIHHGDNYYLVLTEKKLYKYGLSDCSIYTTCADTMASLNPRCGWCLYSNRSTTKEACPATDIWVPSLTECPKLTAVPQGIHVNDASQLVRVTIENVNISYNEPNTHTCVFLYSNKEIEKPADWNGNNFTCESPTVSVHALATLQLLSNDQVVLAQTSFWFYSCAHFERCGECVVTQGTQCIWCPSQYRCQRPSEICSDKSLTITRISDCPSLAELGKMYVPDGIDTSVSFSILNSIKTSPPYTCEVDRKITPASYDGVTFNCLVVVSMLSGKRADFGLKIRYAPLSVELDDNYNTKVTVYRCVELGRTCGECRALRKAWYSCKWSARCQYGTETGEGACPLPLIANIKPLNGPSKGNTDITISGREFGSSTSSIQSPVMVGEHECGVKTVITFEDPDFEQPIPEMIVCTTSLCQHEKIGLPLTVTVSVDNQTSSNLNFTYLTPSVKGISPTKGPIAGETVITLNGDHLGIGNIGTTEIDIDSVTCSSVNLALNYNSYQYEITCQTNSVSATKTASVVLTMDGQPYNQISFDYVTNPIIGDLIPNSGFLSGGTLLAVDGIYLNNAGRAEITTVYKNQKSTVRCVLESKNKALCRVPAAPDGLKTDLAYSDATSTRTVSAPIVVAFDGVNKTFNLKYFVDPYIKAFDKTVAIDSGQTLLIQGTHLDLAAGKVDYTVTVGTVSCAILNLTSTSLQCVILRESTTKNGLQEVNVTVGNINTLVGYTRYKSAINEESTTDLLDEKSTSNESNTGPVVGSVVGVILLLIGIGIVLGVWKYRRVQSRAKPFDDKANCCTFVMGIVKGGNGVQNKMNAAHHDNAGQKQEISIQTFRPDSVEDHYSHLNDVDHHDDDDDPYDTAHPGPERRNNSYMDVASVPEEDDERYGTADPGPEAITHSHTRRPLPKIDDGYLTAQLRPEMSADPRIAPVPNTGDDGYLTAQRRPETGANPNTTPVPKTDDGYITAQPGPETGADPRTEPVPKSGDDGYLTAQPRPEASTNHSTTPVTKTGDDGYLIAQPRPETGANPYMGLAAALDRDSHQYSTAQQEP